MKLTEKKRESIIKAAIEEFREHGFLGAKTTRIAKKAHVSSRTLYNHFESKEVLFQAISKIMIERKTTVATVPFDPARDLETQFIDPEDAVSFLPPASLPRHQSIRWPASIAQWFALRS